MIHRTDNTTTTTSRPVRSGWDISMQYYYIDPGRRGHNQSRAPDPYFRRDGTLRHPAPPPPEGGGGLRGAGGGSRQRRARGGARPLFGPRRETPLSRGRAGRGDVEAPVIIICPGGAGATLPFHLLLYIIQCTVRIGRMIRKKSTYLDVMGDDHDVVRTDGGDGGRKFRRLAAGGGWRRRRRRRRRRGGGGSLERERAGSRCVWRGSDRGWWSNATAAAATTTRDGGTGRRGDGETGGSSSRSSGREVRVRRRRRVGGATARGQTAGHPRCMLYRHPFDWIPGGGGGDRHSPSPDDATGAPPKREI